MGIEEFCGRFKLSVKIGIIGAAFILTIAAIGGLSFFATGVLQKRLDSSSDVVNALTGFKNVYASMTRFLQDASEDSRGELYQKLDGQKAILHTAENHLSAIDGKAVITTAASETAEIETKVEDLWEIHQSEASIRKRLERDLSSIGSLQQKIATEQLALEGSVREREQSAKQLLEHAEYLDGTSRFFQKLAADVRAASPEKIPGIANARVRFIAKQLEAHARDFSPAVATSLRDLAAALNGLSSATITPSDVISADIVSRSVRLESAIKGDAVENMRAATRIFGDLNQRSALTVAVLGNSRRLSYDLAVLQSVAARHLGQPTAAQEEAVLSAVGVIEADLKKFSGAASGLTFFDGLPAALIPGIADLRAATSELQQVALDRRASFDEAAATIESVWSSLGKLVLDQKAVADQERRRANALSITAVIAGVAIAAFAAWLLIVTLKTPIQRITAVMLKMAGGKDAEIGNDIKRLDEIGDMARALAVFRDNAQAKIRIEAESAAQRLEAEGERARNEAERQASNLEIETAVSHLADGLERLAKGDISLQIEARFSGPLEKLRNDFNSSLSHLNDTLVEIRNEALQLEDSGNRLGGSANELSRRSEMQAASLEETAAAMEQIATIVQSTASQAEKVNRAVGETKSAADDSSRVAANALQAMVRIETASRQIEQIIGVINEISFQTNLLALNAGVEAARAGESGKGFAVVAQEVRELAQRSGSAAEEVKALIGRAASEVQTGSRMVREMNDVLNAIGTQILSVSNEIETIALASRTQAASVSEVNSSISYMDQITQQNAAMVGQTTDLGQSVSELAQSLSKLVDRFTLKSGKPGDRTANIVNLTAKKKL